MPSDMILHIINGDVAADSLKEAAIEGDVLIWRDVLHDGPVPGGLSLEELSEVRATALDWGIPKREVKRTFDLRDTHLKAIGRYGKVVLWFEHDLYDQLQILQILDWLSNNAGEKTELSIVCVDHFEGVEPFYGIGQLTADQFLALAKSEAPVTEEMLALAVKGWASFRSSDPGALLSFLETDFSPLPFLRKALLRFLAEYPGKSDGLGRTEREILRFLEDGPLSPAPLFGLVAEKEEARFMGDWSFWHLIAGLTSGTRPLIRMGDGAPFQFPSGRIEKGDPFHSQSLELTQDGRDVLAGKVDRVSTCGYDRWFGGVHLESGKEIWRFDPVSQSLHREASDG